MSRDEDLLSVLDLRDDGLVPVGKGSLDGELEGLKHGKLGLGRTLSIPGILDNVLVVRVILLHGRRGHVKGAPPDFDLLLTLNRKMILG